MAAKELYELSLVNDANLKGYWRFEDDYLDVTSNNNDLTANNSPAFVAAEFGKGVDMELSSSQWLSISDASQIGLDISGSFSFSFTVKLEQLPSTAGADMIIGGKYLAAGNQRSYRVLIQNTNNILIQYSGDGVNLTSISSTNAFFKAADVGVLTKVIVCVNVAAKTAKMYKKGIEQPVSAGSGAQTSVFNGTAPFEIGSTAGGSPIDGVIDDFAVFDRLLTDAEVLAITNNDLTLQLTGSFSNWLDKQAPTGISYGTTFYVGEENTGVIQVSRGIIKFDLSSIPAGSLINSAQMVLTYQGNDFSSNARAVNVYRILRSVIGSQASWNNYATGTPWGTAGCSNTTTDRENTNIGDSPTQSATPVDGDVVTFNLTASKIQEMIDGVFTNNGFLIQVATETDDMVAYKGHSDAKPTNRPKLIVNYTPPATGQPIFFRGGFAIG